MRTRAIFSFEFRGGRHLGFRTFHGCSRSRPGCLFIVLTLVLTTRLHRDKQPGLHRLQPWNVINPRWRPPRNSKLKMASIRMRFKKIIKNILEFFFTNLQSRVYYQPLVSQGGLGRAGQLPRAALFGGGTFGVLGSFVRNVLLQIRFKCLDFAQKCCQNAGNAISETQISKMFRGDMPPDPPSWTRLSYVACTPPGGGIFEFRPRVVNRLATPVLPTF